MKDGNAARDAAEDVQRRIEDRELAAVPVDDPPEGAVGVRDDDAVVLEGDLAELVERQARRRGVEVAGGGTEAFVERAAP